MSLFEHLKLIEGPRSNINLNHDLVDGSTSICMAILSLVHQPQK